jgi:hypothetical protein
MWWSKKLSIGILICFVLIGCKKEQSMKIPYNTELAEFIFPFTLDEIGSATFYSYYNRWMIQEEESFSVEWEVALQENQDFPYDNKFLKNKVELTPEEIELFYNGLSGKVNSNKKTISSDCFEPRQLLLFRNKEDKFLAHVEWSWECNNFQVSKNLQGIPLENILQWSGWMLQKKWISNKDITVNREEEILQFKQL